MCQVCQGEVGSTVWLTKATVRGLSEQMEAGVGKAEIGRVTRLFRCWLWLGGVGVVSRFESNALANSALFSSRWEGDCLGIEGQDGRGI